MPDNSEHKKIEEFTHFDVVSHVEYMLLLIQLHVIKCSTEIVG